jgi:hypothetical protein
MSWSQPAEPRSRSVRRVKHFVAIVPSVLLLAACEVIFGGTPSVNTQEVAKKATESLKAKGIDVQSIRCPDEFAYRKDHDTLLCQATMVGGVIVGVPIKFHDLSNFNVEIELPGQVWAHASDLVAETERTYGKDVKLVCPPELVFWKGKDSVTCQLTVEGRTEDTTVSVHGSQIRFAVPPERFIQAGLLESSLAGFFQREVSPGAKVDCGQPRLARRTPGRKVECTVTWEGGHARIVTVFKSPTSDPLVVAETEGLHAAPLEALLTLYFKPDPGNSWSCREGTQIVRGQPFTCDFVTGRKRVPTKITSNEDLATIDLVPRPRE